MATPWYIRKNDQIVGPLSGQQLRELALATKLRPDDSVRKGEDGEFMPAHRIKDLFAPDDLANRPSPPPPVRNNGDQFMGNSSDVFPRDPSVTPVPPPLPQSTQSNHRPSRKTPAASSVAGTMQAGLADLVSTAKQAKDLASAHARKTQITQMMLPKAYLALGKHVFEKGKFQEQFSDLFQRITSINDELAKVAASTKERPQATDLKGKLQSGAAHVMAQGQAAKLTLQGDSLLKQLGRKAFESHGISAGPLDLVTPITSANEEISRLDAQIGQLSSGDKGPLWQRIPVAAILTLSCFPVGLYLLWYNPRISRRTKLIWGGGLACLLILGGIITRIKIENAKGELAAASQLWSADDKPAAISKYRALVKSHFLGVPQSERSVIIGRVIDFDAESSNNSSVEELLKIADEEHVVPSVTSEKARVVIATRNAEQKQLGASHPSGERGTAASTDQSGRLTEGFYPFTPGSMRQTVKRLHLGELGIQSRQEITHERGGTIRTRTLEKFMTPATGAELPPDDPTEQRYQKRDGFIEIGNRFENNPWFYERVFKIGASVGDTWKSETGPWTYTVLPFETNEVEGRSVRCAVIETTTTDPKGRVLGKLATAYGQGIGPVSVTSRVVNGNGDMEISWTENLRPTLKK